MTKKEGLRYNELMNSDLDALAKELDGVPAAIIPPVFGDEKATKIADQANEWGGLKDWVIDGLQSELIVQTKGKFLPLRFSGDSLPQEILELSEFGLENVVYGFNLKEWNFIAIWPSDLNADIYELTKQGYNYLIDNEDIRPAEMKQYAIELKIL